MYGPSYVKLGQKVTAEEGVTTPEAVIASQVIGKAYFYPDVWGSTVFATTKEGSILRYGERDLGRVASFHGRRIKFIGTGNRVWIYVL